MSNKRIELRKNFVSDIEGIITSARNSAIRSVDFEQVKMYWKLGDVFSLKNSKKKTKPKKNKTPNLTLVGVKSGVIKIKY